MIAGKELEKKHKQRDDDTTKSRAQRRWVSCERVEGSAQGIEAESSVCLLKRNESMGRRRQRMEGQVDPTYERDGTVEPR